MIRKVKIIDCIPSNWYRRHLNALFEVEVKPDSTIYRVLDTPDNRKVLTKEHLWRLSALGLGIRGTHTIFVDTNSNKGSRFLLEKEID